MTTGTADRWRRVSELYHAALERDVRHRQEFVAAACAGDDALRRDVESLLQYNETEYVTGSDEEPVASGFDDPQGILAGRQLGSYQLGALLGAGGMGEVYSAHDPRLNRDVAIKVVPAVLAADPERFQRLRREARAAAALNHPNILAVHDIGTHDGIP